MVPCIFPPELGIRPLLPGDEFAPDSPLHQFPTSSIDPSALVIARRRRPKARRSGPSRDVAGTLSGNSRGSAGAADPCEETTAMAYLFFAR